jgi:acetolactate synthase-1/2/3 large subunit
MWRWVNDCCISNWPPPFSVSFSISEYRPYLLKSISFGFNLVEYDPEVWNAKEDKKIIHIDSIAANIQNQYQPSIELLGNIHDNIKLVAEETSTVNNVSYPELQDELNKVIDQDTVICCDIGSVYMWLARYLISNHPHQILFSNGQQTLGVA